MYSSERDDPVSTFSEFEIIRNALVKREFNNWTAQLNDEEG